VTRPAISLQLSLALGSEPISGTISYPDGHAHHFTGWIELAAALEEAHNSEDPTVVAHAHKPIPPDGPE
jgi:hypothetical protein